MVALVADIHRTRFWGKHRSPPALERAIEAVRPRRPISLLPAETMDSRSGVWKRSPMMWRLLKRRYVLPFSAITTTDSGRGMRRNCGTSLSGVELLCVKNQGKRL